MHGHKPPGLTRRALLGSTGALGLAGAAPASLEGLERAANGRLGLALLDTGTGRTTGHRTAERFALCSTFKLLLAGLVLQAADRGELALGDAVPISMADLVAPSPVTAPHVGRTLTIGELAEGTQKTSDNAAANLLMRRLGGPDGVTRRLRAFGDPATRLDRYEPDMTLVVGRDPRDTTTPAAIAATVARMVVGDGLTPGSRAGLARWLEETATGMNRLRAGAPAGWRVGDKTGTGYGPGRPTRVNDIAILWPPHRAPLVVAAFLELPTSDRVRPADEAVLAAAMRIAVEPFRAVQ